MRSYMKTTYEYTKLRKHFGRQPLFQNVPAHMLDSINPNKEEQKNYILKNPIHREIQATNPVSAQEINTPLLETRDHGVDHQEGGWPREIHPYNEEHTQRHRRRVMHDDAYCETISNLAPSMMHYIAQNNAIEMYQTYFSDFHPQESMEKYSVRVANEFRDFYERPISSVKFTNEKNPKLAVSYCYKTCMPEPKLNETNHCYLWDIHNQKEPTSTFSPKFPCWQIACSPVTPELIICGLENGTVNLFDIRQGVNAVSTSLVHNSHRESVTSILYINSRANTEFFSGSCDGQCLWWDLRQLSAPIDVLPICVRTPPSETPNPSNAEGISFLEYDYGLPTRFLCGTESGLVVNVNRMGKTHSEKLASYWNAHNGPVQSVERSKCTFRMFITCGDLTVKIWSEEIRTAPIIEFNPYKNLVTDVCWAPLRYSSHMSICAGGFFYYWDLLRKYKEPIVSLNVSKHALLRITPHKDGQLVVTGDTNGSLNLLQLSNNLATPGPRDKVLMQQTYERERRREHIMDNRLKEIRLKTRIEEEQATDIPISLIDEEEVERINTDEYFRIVQEEIKQLNNSNDTTE